MAAQTDIFDQLKAWIRTGVFPFGAQVRRMEGRWETPLSSWKKIQAWRRRAVFLRRAIVPPSTLLPFRCRARGLGRPVAVKSTPSNPGSSRHGQDDNEPPSPARSPYPPVEGSTDRL